MVAELSQVQGTDYLVIGVAHCQRRNSEGRAEPISVLEPIPATALEAMHNGLQTTFCKILAIPFAEVVQEGVLVPESLQDPDLELGEDFSYRAQAAARTYKAKPHLRTLPLGELCTAETGLFRLNYAPELKRLLGARPAISDSDNIKQHSHTHAVL